MIDMLKWAKEMDELKFQFPEVHKEYVGMVLDLEKQEKELAKLKQDDRRRIALEEVADAVGSVQKDYGVMLDGNTDRSGAKAKLMEAMKRLKGLTKKGKS